MCTSFESINVSLDNITDNGSILMKFEKNTFVVIWKMLSIIIHVQSFRKNQDYHGHSFSMI